jgi:hypothetical protein
MLYLRDTLLKDLRSNIIEVHFTKADGSNRVMRCTLIKEMLPESYRLNLSEQSEEKTFHKENTDVIAVWDVNENGWRSFRIDSVYYAAVIGAH